MNFHESPEIAKRGLSPDLSHILELPSSIKMPALKGSVLTTGQEFSLLEDIPENLKGIHLESIKVNETSTRKNDNKDIAIVIQSVEIQDGAPARASLKSKP